MTTKHDAVHDLDGVGAIPVGAFADPSFPSAMASVDEDTMHGCVTVPAAKDRVA